jgi:hypothetical protein
LIAFLLAQYFSVFFIFLFLKLVVGGGGGVGFLYVTQFNQFSSSSSHIHTLTNITQNFRLVKGLCHEIFFLAVKQFAPTAHCKKNWEI